MKVYNLQKLQLERFVLIFTKFIYLLIWMLNYLHLLQLFSILCWKMIQALYSRNIEVKNAVKCRQQVVIGLMVNNLSNFSNLNSNEKSYWKENYLKNMDTSQRRW